jgi:hypothetical protein
MTALCPLLHSTQPPDNCRPAVRTLSGGRMRHVIQYSPLSYQANRKGWSRLKSVLAQSLLGRTAVLSLRSTMPHQETPRTPPGREKETPQEKRHVWPRVTHSACCNLCNKNIADTQLILRTAIFCYFPFTIFGFRKLLANGRNLSFV